MKKIHDTCYDTEVCRSHDGRSWILNHVCDFEVCEWVDSSFPTFSGHCFVPEIAVSRFARCILKDRPFVPTPATLEEREVQSPPESGLMPLYLVIQVRRRCRRWWRREFRFLLCGYYVTSTTGKDPRDPVLGRLVFAFCGTGLIIIVLSGSRLISACLQSNDGALVQGTRGRSGKHSPLRMTPAKSSKDHTLFSYTKWGVFTRISWTLEKDFALSLFLKANGMCES